MKNLINCKIDIAVMSTVKGGTETVIGTTSDGWHIVRDNKTGSIYYD